LNTPAPRPNDIAAGCGAFSAEVSFRILQSTLAQPAQPWNDVAAAGG
jgi:hypothetical protein